MAFSLWCTLHTALISSTFNYENFLIWHDHNFQFKSRPAVRAFVATPTITGFDPIFGSWLSTPVPSNIATPWISIRLRNDYTLQHNHSRAHVYLTAEPLVPYDHNVSCGCTSQKNVTSHWICKRQRQEHKGIHGYTREYITITIPFVSPQLPATTKPIHISFYNSLRKNALNRTFGA